MENKLLNLKNGELLRKFIVIDDNIIKINLFGIKIKFKKNKNYLSRYLIYRPIKYYKDFMIFLWKFFHKKRNYKIIPFGINCFSRCITTFSGIKPTSRQGEKSLPFDLAFFFDIDKIIDLVETKFNNFYCDIENKYDEGYEETIWESILFNAKFVHDGHLTKEEFINRYNNRIKNLYEYINDKSKYLYFVITCFENISEEQFERMLNVIKKYRHDNDFLIVCINWSENMIKTNLPNIRIINQIQNKKIYNIIDDDINWVKDLKNRDTKIVQKIYYDITWALLKIINE